MVPRRVILFTEYGDTKRYLLELLSAAVAYTHDGDQRILQFHGGMGDDARQEVQRRFNSAPDAESVRILIATDAAREGVNLQAHGADLLHMDIPWNPSRLEQRNGRIDRTMQPADEVRCHYFVYPDRTEDQVLETVVRKIATVQRELGSLGRSCSGSSTRRSRTGSRRRRGPRSRASAPTRRPPPSTPSSRRGGPTSRPSGPRWTAPGATSRPRARSSRWTSSRSAGWSTSASSSRGPHP